MISGAVARHFRPKCHPDRPSAHYRGLCTSCYRPDPSGKFGDPVNSLHRRRLKQRRHALRAVGLTLEDEERILKKQNGVCAICYGPPVNGRKNLSIDHDHATGRFRAFLCDDCNTAIGLFEDNPKLLKQAIAYLEKHRASPEQLLPATDQAANQEPHAEYPGPNGGDRLGGEALRSG